MICAPRSTVASKRIDSSGTYRSLIRLPSSDRMNAAALRNPLRDSCYSASLP
jgi:hypothetical protein